MCILMLGFPADLKNRVSSAPESHLAVQNEKIRTLKFTF